MNLFRRTLAPALAAIAMAALTNFAAAQVTSEQQSAIRANCRSDFMSKCSGVQPGGKEAIACLQKNVASLGPACKTAVSATIPAPAPAAAAAKAAPAPAAAAPTAPTPPKVTSAPPPSTAVPPRAAAPKPPQEKKAQAAPKPPAPPQRAAVAPASPAAADAAPPPTPEQLKAIKFTCRRDLSAHCRGLPDGAESIACLQRNGGKLAPDCKTSLAAITDTAPLAPAAPGTPPATRAPNAPIVMTAVIGRACLRDLALHCRNTGIGDGQKIACLTARGSKLSVVCKAALKITDPVR